MPEHRFNVFGQLVAISGTQGVWSAHFLGTDGKRRKADFEVPGFLSEEELRQYLADLFHESATPSHHSVYRLGPAVHALGYDAIASEWDAVRVSLSEPERWLLEFVLSVAPPASRILDLGCGTGRPIAEHGLSLGYRVTGVDRSSRMLELARRRLPRGEWVEATIEEYVPVGGFHAAIAWDSVFHIPRERHLGIFRRVRDALTPHSRFLLTVGGSDHPAFTDSMFGHEFFYDSHPPEKALGFLREAGFEIAHSEFLGLPTAGRDKGRFAIVAIAA